MPAPPGITPSGPTLAQALSLALDAEPDTLGLSPAQWRVLHALRRCRTPALGGHQYRCQACGHDHFVPHSCGNRHCPQCQGVAAARWLAQQEAVLLPVPCFHLVFTLPHALNGLLRQNRRALYELLFRAVSQTLLDHYHLHGIVTGGAWQPDAGRWQAASGRYLFSIRALSEVFAAKYRDGLKALYDRGQLAFHGQLSSAATPAGFAALLRAASRKPWVVYAKKPFAGPQQVLAYLGRYTHRVAISPRRLLALDPEARTVRFDYKDYAQGARHKTMTLGVTEFVRRERGSRGGSHARPGDLRTGRRRFHSGLSPLRGAGAGVDRHRAQTRETLPSDPRHFMSFQWPNPSVATANVWLRLQRAHAPVCTRSAAVVIPVVPGTRPPGLEPAGCHLNGPGSGRPGRAWVRFSAFPKPPDGDTFPSLIPRRSGAAQFNNNVSLPAGRTSGHEP